MDTLKKGWHCAYQTHYHIVFPVKYRKALLSEPIVATLKQITNNISERYELEIEQMGSDQNHIHLLLSFHPKYSIGQIVRLYKSITARELFSHHKELKKELWGGEFWSDGYYAATIGERGNWKVVEKYVKEQGYKPEDVQLRLL
jgi:putative transposase